MFSDITIERFRGIRYAHIPELGRVNVFFGKNNCGKSSLLEAVFLVCGQSNPQLPININILRGYRTLHSMDDLSIDFYGLDTTSPIHISAGGNESRDLEISTIVSSSKQVNLEKQVDTSSMDTDGYYGLKLQFGHNQSSEIIIKDSEQTTGRVNKSRTYQEQLKATLLTPRLTFNSADLAQKLSTMITNKEIGKVLSVLRIIEPKIQDITTNNDRILVDIGLSRFLPIAVMGDGILKLLDIIITIANCANGVVLIDEVDNGLHYSVMPLLWKAICTAAIENNVQLFATTHNIDSLKGLNTSISEGGFEPNLLSAYKLVRIQSFGTAAQDELKTLRYTAENMNYMITQEIEMR